jgi:hypothetical protein
MLSCGIGSSSFNKQKYTSLKKIRPENELPLEVENIHSHKDIFDDSPPINEEIQTDENQNLFINSEIDNHLLEGEQVKSINSSEKLSYESDVNQNDSDSLCPKKNSNIKKTKGNGWWITLYSMLILAGIGVLLLGVYFSIYGGLNPLSAISLLLGTAMIITSIILFTKLSSKKIGRKTGNGGRIFLYVILISGAIVALLIGAWITAWAGGIELAGILLLLLGIALLIITILLIKRSSIKNKT